ncbi:LPXTG-motif cell wall-anchored protein [Leifsonia sp. AK011]|uniref:LPXTG cell wall anchor domain-containing protein n=1 Tax=Leifsonia sp. AK011 TaxID=2723075 RepID=UPI0015C929B4|nr:LPXTG cell wall anchor domain-containing protein [Leifsonia sp. AK011]NYF09498.1 LPXTG-motif cell wall-anchored protein [Leifsonia sp. AK011]
MLTTTRTRIGAAAFGALTVSALSLAALPTAAVADDCVPLTLDARVVLGGAFDAQTGLMRDDLRTGAAYGVPVLPSTEPYSALGFYLHGGEGATGDLATAAAPADDVVDWVLVELRLPTDPTQVVATDAILVQRDGDLARAAQFSVPAGDYYVAIEHRNHLGVMTATPVTLGATTPLVDFADPAFDVWDRTDVSGVDYDGSERYISGGVASLWWGDVDHNGAVIFQGGGNDTEVLQSTVLTSADNVLQSPSYIDRRYVGGDVNLDGAAIFQGQNNDADWIYNSDILTPINTGNDAAITTHLDQVPVAVPGPDLSGECVVDGVTPSVPTPNTPVLAATGSSSSAWVALLALGAAALGGLALVRSRSRA